MIKRLKVDGKEVVLVGTAHVSHESIKLVEETIEKESPDVIGVELDRERLAQILSGKKWEQTNLVEIIESGKTYLFLLNILLANMQRQIGENMGVKPGAEMLAAIKKSQQKKLPIQLLDRDVRVTLRRAFSGMGFVEKAKLGGSIIGGFFGLGEKITPQQIEELKKQDLINSLMKELSKTFPSIKKVLVDERDAYISEMIKHSPGKRIVAVVGAGHLEGIEKAIKSEKRANLSELNQEPKKSNTKLKLSLLIPLVFVLLLGYGFYAKGITTTASILLYWILITGACSAIGAIIARAHPFSVLAAFISAPITTLHPALAAGWIAGLVEAKYNSPKVLDFEQLPNVTTLGGFYKNKVTHLLIVAALTNLGATIGVLIAFPAIVALLA